MPQVNLDQRRAWRLSFLRVLYDVTKGDKPVLVDMWALGKDLSIPREEITGVTDHLDGKGLLEYVALGGQIAITHAGRKAVVDAMASPVRPTRDFPPIKSGGDMDLSVLSSLVEALKERQADLDQLGVDAAAEARAELATLVAQASSPRPKRDIVCSGLESLTHIFEHASGSCLAMEILPMLLTCRAKLGSRTL